MLGHFKMKVEGRHHSGIDDCHNISRIFQKLVEFGLDKKIFLTHTRVVRNITFVQTT